MSKYTHPTPSIFRLNFQNSLLSLALILISYAGISQRTIQYELNRVTTMIEAKDFNHADHVNDSIIRETSDSVLIAQCLVNFGIINMRTNKYALAINNFSVANEIFEKEKIDSLAGWPLYYLGFIYNQLGEPKESENLLENSVRAFRQTNKISEAASALSLLASINRDAHEFDVALDYFDQVAKIRITQQDTAKITNALLSMGEIHLKQNNLKEAQKAFETALKLNQKTGNKSALASALFNIGKLEASAKKKNTAKNYFNEALNLRNSIKDSVGIGFCLDELARLENADYSFIASMRLVDRATELAQKTKNNALIEDNIKVHMDSYWRQAKFKDYAKWLTKLHEHDSTVMESRHESRIKFLKIIHEVDKIKSLNAKMLLQNNENDMSFARKQGKSELIIYFVIAAAIIVLLLFWILFQSVKHKTNLTRQKEHKEFLQTQLIYRLRNNLQLITNIMGIQISGIVNDGLRQTVLESMNRVRAMNLIYQNILENHDLSDSTPVNLTAFMKAVTSNLMTALGKVTSVVVAEDIEEITLPFSKAIPLGLIINEAISDTLVNGIDPKNSILNVSLKSEDGKVQIIVKGNNTKVVNKLELEQRTSTRIIHSQAKDADATVSFENDKTGKTFTFTISAI